MGLWRRRRIRGERMPQEVMASSPENVGLAELDPDRASLYRQLFVEAFRAGYREGVEAIELTPADLRMAVRRLLRQTRRFPDHFIRVVRASGLPRFVTDRGFASLEVVAAGRYRLTRPGDEVDVSAVPLEGERVLVATKVPSLIARHVRQDRDAVMGALTHARALEEFFGHPCHLLQSSLRATGTTGEPCEADYFFLLEDGGRDVSIPVTVTGNGGTGVPATRMRSAVRAALAGFPGLAVRPLSVGMDEERRILVTEYRWKETDRGEIAMEGLRSRRYRFEPQLLAWRARA